MLPSSNQLDLANITNFLTIPQVTSAERKWISWLKESISFKSELSKMRWPSVLFMTVHSLAHFIVAFVLDIDNLAANWVGLQGIILAFLLIFNVAVNLWDTKLRYKELLMKSEQLLRLIRQCSRDRYLLKHWSRRSQDLARAKSLFAPRSPCIHQTITYRDESCLNLPDYLLVRGDIVHLYPGDRAPARCVSIETVNCDETPDVEATQSKIFLEEGCVFYSTNSDEHESGKPASGEMNEHSKIFMNSSAKLRKAICGRDFLVLSTPYIKTLQITLQQSHRRPVNSVEKECFIISRKYFETFVVPSVFILSTIVTAIHYGYLDLTDNEQKIKTISIAYLLLRPSLTIMPFLPWMFPCFWMLANAYGSARLLCCAETQRRKHSKSLSSDSASPGQLINSPPEDKPDKTINLLATPNAASSSDQNKRDDGAEDMNRDVKFLDIFKLFIDLIMGKKGHVWRSSSLLQVLGSLTSLCVIDKVGILSWSNPTPEKVFVLERKGSEVKTISKQTPEQTQLINNSNLQTQSTSVDGESQNHFAQHEDSANGRSGCGSEHVEVDSKTQSHSMSNYTIQPEVLDISQSFNAYHEALEQSWSKQPNRLQFDDLNWQRYLNNLKPLGLAILMNNCCENSFADYFRFYKHINYESMLRCNHIPVVKRRCLCSLSNLIGFSKNIAEGYNYVRQIGAYRLSDPRSMQSGNIVPQIENTNRLKLPLANLVSNLHKSTSTKSYQIFSQGTADIVLDSCAEFWDGKQLCLLDQTIRKKIMDFYHRTSLTSYCSAFSYSPMIGTYDLEDNYIEMPATGSRLTHQLRQLINEREEEYLQNQTINLPHLVRPKPLSNRLVSTGSSQDDSQFNSLSSTPMTNQYFDDTGKPLKNQFITANRQHMSCEDLLDYKTRTKSSETEFWLVESECQKRSSDLDATLDELNNQIFVGMVALQYQACPDFVALVEQLEQACIRFIHFSKENELRSRVFSEKMGLESGWNCHISLQSDQDLDNAEKSEPKDCDIKSVMINTEQVTATTECTLKRYFRLPPNLPSIFFGSKKKRKVYAQPDMFAYSRDGPSLYHWSSLPSLFSKFLTNFSPSPTDQSQKDSKLGGNSIDASREQKPSHVGETHLEHLAQQHGEVAGDSVDNTEGFDSLAFDMSNRAKLPKGIENIRPHLETVDNIPLQVSLFTDCTPALTKEMIEIMQDYGEIVCVIGSASSRVNTPVFLQANASIAIEPLTAQSCQNTCSKVGRRTNVSRKLNKRTNRSLDETVNTKTEPYQASDCTCLNPEVQVHVDLPRKRDRLRMDSQQVEQRLTVPKSNFKLLTDSDEYSGEVSRSRYESSSRSRSYNSSGSSCLSSSSSSSSSTTSSVSKSSSSDSSTSSSEHDSDEFELDHPNEIESDPLNPTDDNAIYCSLVRELPDPCSLATKLASLPCSYSYNRTEPVNLHNLIMEARHFTFKMKNTFVCMICFALSISSAQFLASILFLPPMLSSGLTIWLTVVVVPLMSFTLMNTRMDSQVMKIAVGKNLQLKPENITFFVICYLIKFIPSIIIVVFCFGLIIAHSCKLTGFGSSSLGPCWMFTYVQHSNTTSPGVDEEDLLWSSHLLTAQVCATFLMVLYFGEYSSDQIFKTRATPFTNMCLILLMNSRYLVRFCSQISLNVATKSH